MLWTIVAVMLVLWLLGFSLSIGGSLIHLLLVVALVLWMLTSDTILMIIALGAGYRLFTKDAPEQPDNVVFFQFAGLLAALSGVYYFTK